MIKQIDILYAKYLDENMEKTIGGVQTYITDLLAVFESIDVSVRVVQFSEKDYVYKLSEKSCVAGFCIKEKKPGKRYQMLYDRSLQTADRPEELLTVFATDIIIPGKIRSRCIAIQHGICWDIPLKGSRSDFRRALSRVRGAESLIKRMKKVEGVVCVDYNFLNWYRTQVDRVENTFFVIPNYTQIPTVEFEKAEDEINIIFARRFFEYRGTRVFTNAIKRILDKYPQVCVTVAGSGPDENWMKENLKGYENVCFTRYESKESLAIHGNKHIAVVPTIGSEGTSLSLLEAMAAKCAVICTNVGGMTNIVLNGYNGIMINPGDADALYRAIEALIADPDKRAYLAQKAYETAEKSFCYDVWAQNWRQLIQTLGK